MARYRDWRDGSSIEWLDPHSPDAGSNLLRGTSGDDRLVGTDGKDKFLLFDGGDDIARGGDGNDRFSFGSTLTSADSVIGGDGIDRLFVNANKLDVEFSPEHFKGIERYVLSATDANVVFDDGFGDIRVEGPGGANLRFDASQLTTGRVHVTGFISDDVITGGSQSDFLFGANGADTLTGGLGRDSFFYSSALQSTYKLDRKPDLIMDFSKGDRVMLPIDQTSQFHIGTTSERTGDVLISYDASHDRTVVNVYTDADSEVDMTLLMSGNHSALEIVHESFLVGP